MTTELWDLLVEQYKTFEFVYTDDTGYDVAVDVKPDYTTIYLQYKTIRMQTDEYAGPVGTIGDVCTYKATGNMSAELWNMLCKLYTPFVYHVRQTDIYIHVDADTPFPANTCGDFWQAD